MKKRLLGLSILVFVLMSNITHSEEKVDNKNINSMIFVKGGSFQMGSIEDIYEGPAHHVAVNDFMIAKFEVTQAEYKEVMGNNPSFFEGDNRPVEQVSWYDAIKYCNALSKKEGLAPAYSKRGNLLEKSGDITTDVTKVEGYRLPTEAEWEFAARGGNKSKGTEYSGSDDLEGVAWHLGNSGKETHPVGEKEANELGIYDMSGNVWEWCSDWFVHYSSDSKINPYNFEVGTTAYRVGRGGSWLNPSYYNRVSYRYGRAPKLNRDSLGIRIARTVLKNQ